MFGINAVLLWKTLRFDCVSLNTFPFDLSVSIIFSFSPLLFFSVSGWVECIFYFLQFNINFSSKRVNVRARKTSVLCLEISNVRLLYLLALIILMKPKYIVHFQLLRLIQCFTICIITLPAHTQTTCTNWFSMNWLYRI